MVVGVDTKEGAQRLEDRGGQGGGDSHTCLHSKLR